MSSGCVCVCEREKEGVFLYVCVLVVVSFPFSFPLRSFYIFHTHKQTQVAGPTPTLMKGEEKQLLKPCRFIKDWLLCWAFVSALNPCKIRDQWTKITSRAQLNILLVLLWLTAASINNRKAIFLQRWVFVVSVFEPTRSSRSSTLHIDTSEWSKTGLIDSY